MLMINRYFKAGEKRNQKKTIDEFNLSSDEEDKEIENSDESLI